jgi:hypothetical protein
VKQKYLISKSEDGKQIAITEYGEVDKEIFSVLCRETYDTTKFEKAKEEGINSLIPAFRTRNLFPPFSTAVKIAEGIETCLHTRENETIEVFIDDAETLGALVEGIDIIDDIEDETEQLEDLLDESVDEFDENISIRKISTSIKVDDDDLSDDTGDV